MRKQYYLKPVGNNKFDAWDVDKLVEMTKNLPIQSIRIDDIKELYENYWYQNTDTIPTPKSIADHAKLALESDLKYPIILSKDGRVMDGMHRVLKAILQGDDSIQVIQIDSDLVPDFRAISESDLPY